MVLHTIHFEASIASICVDNFLLRILLLSSSEIYPGLFFSTLVAVLNGFDVAFCIFPNKEMMGENITSFMYYVKISFFCYNYTYKSKIINNFCILLTSFSISSSEFPIFLS